MADRVPMAMVTRRGASVTFAAVLEPVREGQTPAIKIVTWEEDASVLRITVDQGAAKDTITIDAAGKVVVQGGGRPMPATR